MGTLKPCKPVIGIRFHNNGQVTGITEEAQKALYDSGVDQNWKMVKIDSEKFTPELLMKTAFGKRNYTIEFTYHVQNKLVKLKPGKLGIKFRHDGQVNRLIAGAQEALYAVGINKNWKIVKIDS